MQTKKDPLEGGSPIEYGHQHYTPLLVHSATKTETVWVKECSDSGKLHRVGQYVLLVGGAA